MGKQARVDKPEGGERLQKVLARAGFGSRRAAEGLIAAGRVRVNGRVAELGRRVEVSKDKVEVDGSLIPVEPGLAYYLVNKPEGVVTTASDEAGRASVVDLVDAGRRVWPVGRLDIATEGAIILCNDGDLTYRLTHPAFEIPKTYLVEARGALNQEVLKRLRRGVDLDDGPTGPATVRLVDRVAGGALVEITIREGRNRQVRRMLEAVGCQVGGLVRTHIGPIALGRLKPGNARRLSAEEVRALYRACGL